MFGSFFDASTKAPMSSVLRCGLQPAAVGVRDPHRHVRHTKVSSSLTEGKVKTVAGAVTVAVGCRLPDHWSGVCGDARFFCRDGDNTCLWWSSERRRLCRSLLEAANGLKSVPLQTTACRMLALSAAPHRPWTLQLGNVVAKPSGAPPKGKQALLRAIRPAPAQGQSGRRVGRARQSPEYRETPPPKPHGTSPTRQGARDPNPATAVPHRALCSTAAWAAPPSLLPVRASGRAHRWAFGGAPLVLRAVYSMAPTPPAGARGLGPGDAAPPCPSAQIIGRSK